MDRGWRVVFIVLGIVLLLILAAAPFVVLTPRAPKPAGGIDTVAQLEAYFNALVANETPPALAVTVVKDGAVIYAKAFGQADGPGAKAATPDTAFHFWSVTKLFTATAIMQLVEDGKVALDDPVAKYLPDFRTVFSRAAAPITIRQLLAHTSGMKNLGPFDLVGWIHHVEDPPVSQTAIVRDRMGRYSNLASQPGKTGAYSNAGYILLSAVVEAASGESFEDFVRRRILKPLALTSTDFLYNPDQLGRAAAGSHPIFHFYTPLLLMVHTDWFSKWVTTTLRRRMWLAPLYTDYTGPTGLIGTGSDLARFAQAFLAGGELEGGRILGPATVATMLDDGYGPNNGPDGDRMGLGWHWWDEAPIPFKGHGGDGPGFSAQLAIFPEKNMAIVVLANDTLTDRVGLTRLVAGVFGKH